MQFGIKSNIKEVQRGLNDVARSQIPFATAMAINDVLRDIKRNWEKRLRKSIDRPTRFTMQAFAIRRANKRTLSGAIFAKDIQEEYLQWLEEGGTRKPKRRAVLVPVRQRLNKYGNIPRRAVGRAIASPKTFSGAPKGKPRAAGIYQRTGRGRNAGLKLLVHYADDATYKPRLRLIAGAAKTATARLPGAILRAVRRAVGSAR
ncbi:MAG: hypothetical protein AAGL96_14520 [Pseudomonadota bacterium]